MPFIGDGSISRLSFPRPRTPSFWDNDVLMRVPFMRPPDTFPADRDAAVTLIRSGNDGLVSTGDSRTFLNALQPLPALAEKAAAFRRHKMSGAPWIGLHVRHGNGGTTGHDNFW